ncbi:hypothetical protein DFH09DRAFT_1315340 [Mycena vulgaris]|nr:hypothetical protein DFH09DRAFT_1315340 [Mycena vulgaris]
MMGRRAPTSIPRLQRRVILSLPTRRERARLGCGGWPRTTTTKKTCLPIRCAPQSLCRVGLEQVLVDSHPSQPRVALLAPSIASALRMCAHPRLSSQRIRPLATQRSSVPPKTKTRMEGGHTQDGRARLALCHLTLTLYSPPRSRCEDEGGRVPLTLPDDYPTPPSTCSSDSHPRKWRHHEWHPPFLRGCADGPRISIPRPDKRRAPTPASALQSASVSTPRCTSRSGTVESWTCGYVGHLRTVVVVLGGGGEMGSWVRYRREGWPASGGTAGDRQIQPRLRLGEGKVVLKSSVSWTRLQGDSEDERCQI